MFSFLVLALFYSCSSDADLFAEVMDNRIEESIEQVEPISSIAIASPKSGFVPLEVTFEVGDLASKAFAKYEWKFKDGTKSSSSKTVHTFKEVGKHAVELVATDEEGTVLTDSVIVTVNAQPNEAPTAVASASTLSGDAPLNVNFRGSDSSDDKGISTYFWDIPGNPSTSANPTRTFDSPGVYDITLTVTDEEGLQGSDTLTITVNQAPTETTGGSQIPCSVGGGKAGDTGAKIWCWDNINVPAGESSGRDSFSDGQLALNIECSANQVVREGNRLKFQLNPTNPSPASWCSNNYNMRAEIRTMPWKVNQPLGTEEWIGWSYTFGDNYKVDSENPWLFFQMQQGVPGSPPIELAVVPSSLYGANNGEVVVINHANKTETDRTRTGAVPTAGTTLDIVVHVVHNLGSNGLLQIWINGNKVYDKQVGTVHESAPWGGNAKFGIYKWPWREEAGVQKSLQQGITSLETYMGTLRIITRRPGDADHGKDSYSEVAPD